MRKSTSIPKSKALSTVTYLYFGVTADNENLIIQELINQSATGPMLLDKFTRAEIVKNSGLTDSNVGTIISRLEQKGIIKREGKAIYLPPIFNKWNDVQEILFRINEEQKP